MRAAILTVLALAPLAAEVRMVEYVLPRGATRGTTVEATFTGVNMDKPREVFFYRPGIKASAIKEDKPGTQVKATFEIAPDCPLGEHQLRLRTATGLSELVTFWVGPFPTVDEKEKSIGENDTPEKAQAVALNSTVRGQILPGEQVDKDVYKVEAKKGQRLSFEVESVHLGTVHQGGENDVMIRVLDADKKEIARNDDSALHVQDPIVSMIAPRDGVYYVEVAQQMYQSPRLGYYLLHLGSFLRPAAIYPAGGEAGKQIEARVIDGTGEFTQAVMLPAKTGPFDFFAGKDGEQPPTGNTLRVSPYPNVLEGSLVVAKLPAAFNGIVSEPGESDLFLFRAKKGDKLDVRTWARALGSPIDAKIAIRPAGSQRKLLDADDATLGQRGFFSARGTWYLRDQLDPVGVVDIPADGDYELIVEDTRGMGGKDFVYRVEIEPHRDSIRTFVSTREGYQVPRIVGFIVPKGNRWTIDVQLGQGLGNTYKGELELEAVGLPKGVTMMAARVPKNATTVPVQFIAEADAPEQTALIELRVKAVDPAVQLDSGSTQGMAFINRSGLRPLHYVFVDKYALAVTEAAPFHVELEQPKIALAQSGQLALNIKVVRHGDFKGVVEIQPDWLPNGVSKGGAITIAADKTDGQIMIQAGEKASSGVYKIAMNATTTTGGDSFSGVGRVRASSPFIDLRISEPYLTITLNRAAVERGGRGHIAATIQQNKAFAGKAEATLKRLPAGVKLVGPLPHITAGDKQVTFEVEASKDALVGQYKDIFCEVTIVENGQPIHQQTGSGIIRVDPERVKTATR